MSVSKRLAVTLLLVSLTVLALGGIISRKYVRLYFLRLSSRSRAPARQITPESLNNLDASVLLAEANRLSIPVVAVVDTNCDPDVIDWRIPGNDDAIRAIRLFTAAIADAVVEGKKLAEERDRGKEDEGGEAESESAEAAGGTEEEAR